MRKLNEREINAVEKFLKRDHPPALPPDLKIIAMTLAEEGIVKLEGGRVIVSEEARQQVDDAKDPY